MPEKPTPEQPKETPGKEPEVTARKLVPNDMILGEQGEPLTVKKIAGGRTLRFEVEDETGGKTILGESQVNKLLKKQKELIESEKTGSGEKSASNTSETSAPNPAEPSSPPAPGVTETKTEEGVTKPEPPPSPEPPSKPEGSPTPLPKDAPLPTPGKKSAAAKEKPAEAETGGKEPVRIGNWTEIDRHFPEAAGTLRQLMHPANASIPKFLGIIGKFNEAHQKPVGLVNRKWRRLSNGRTLTFRWDGQGGQQIVCTLTPDEEKRTKTERGVAEKGTAPEASDTPTPPTSEPTLEAAPAEPEPTTTTDPEATTEEPAPETGTEAAPETPEPPKTPEEVLEQVYGSNPDFKEAVEALKNPDLSAADFVSKLTEFNTRTPLKGSPQEVRYELPSGRVVIAMWDSEGNVGVGGQLTEEEREAAAAPAEPEPVEATPEPLKISAELKGKLEDAQIALARDLAHNRNSKKSLQDYESVKKEVLAKLNDEIWSREAAGEKITPELLNEFVALTLTNEALALSDAIRVEKEKVGKGWKERAKHWWRSDTARKIRLGVSFALLGIAGGAATGGIAPLAAGALTLRGLLAAGGMAEIVQRFYEISLKGKAEKALEKNAEDMAEAELLHNIGASVLSDQMRESIPQNKLKAMEREIAERITKEEIAKVTEKIEAGGEITSEYGALYSQIENYLTLSFQAIQKEQEAQAKGWKRVRIVGLAAATAFGVAAAMGAGAEHAPVQIGKSFAGGWLGGWLFRSGLGGFLRQRGTPEHTSARIALIAGIAGALAGGAAANEISGTAHVETPTGHETPPATPEATHTEPSVGTVPETPSPTTELQTPGPAPDTHAPGPEATPGTQPEAQGTTPPVISETTTPGQPETTASPETIKFEGAPELQGATESGDATWAGLEIDKEGVAHNVGVDLSGDGIADKNVDIKIDDFKTGHGTLTGDILNEKGEVVYEKGTVVQVWDKDWNNTASGDAGLVARVNVMKDLDGDGKFETQVGFDKDGNLHWTHQDSVQAKWDDNFDSAEFKTDGHLDNFAKGTDAFGFQGFEVTGETPQEIAHNLADQWAALSGQATPSAELVAQFENAVTSHPELVEAHNTDHLWTTNDLKTLDIKATEAAHASEAESIATELSKKYPEIANMRAGTWEHYKTFVLDFLKGDTPATFKGVEGTQQEQLLNALSSGEKPDVYYAPGAGGTPDKYFVHIKTASGEYQGFITPTK